MAAKQYLVPINLNQNELQNAVMQVLAVAPSSPVLGQYYFDSALGEVPLFRQSGGWLDLRARSTHTGTQLAATISDFSTAAGTVIAAAPVNTATQTALNLKADLTLVGAVNGIASLDGTGKVPSSQLPSYVDDVLEYTNLAAFPGTGTSGIIYVAADTGKAYRWSGTVYTEIVASPGTTDAITEGSTNLYFTNARADARIAAASIDALSDVVLTTPANNDVLKFNGTNWVNSPAGTGATNLTVTPSPTNVIVESDTGTDATLPLADATNSGLMSPAQFTKLATAARTFTALVGGATSVAITHGLANQWVNAQLFDATTFKQVECDIELTSANVVTFIFATAPAAGAYRCVVAG